MDICEEIDKAKVFGGEMAQEYALAATFGNTSDKKLYDILRLNCYIRTLERNLPETRKVKLLTSGTTVLFSSLKKQNNNLILDTACLDKYVDIEVRPCLSDEEICKIVELMQVMCYECKSC